jgi:hypothetical protein
VLVLAVEVGGISPSRRSACVTGDWFTVAGSSPACLPAPISVSPSNPAPTESSAAARGARREVEPPSTTAAAASSRTLSVGAPPTSRLTAWTSSDFPAPAPRNHVEALAEFDLPLPAARDRGCAGAQWTYMLRLRCPASRACERAREGPVGILDDLHRHAVEANRDLVAGREIHALLPVEQQEHAVERAHHLHHQLAAWC